MKKIVTLFFSVLLYASLFGQVDCPNNEVTNGEFESTSQGNANDWVILRNPSDILFLPKPQTTADSYSGNSAVIATGPDAAVVYEPFGNGQFSNPAGLTYRINFCAKIEGNPSRAAVGAVYINGASLSGFDALDVINTEYECFTYTFVPQTTGTFFIGFGIESTSPNDKIYVDDYCLEILDNCQVGAVCDDGDPTTQGDVFDEFCQCKGTLCEGIFANAGLDQATLLGDYVTLTATGGSNFIWNNGETTQSITVSPEQTTTYEVCTYDVVECQDCDQVEVSIIETYDISGNVWNDVNQNGCKDSGETHFTQNVRIDIYSAIGDIQIVGKNTDPVNGLFEFTNFVSGEYYLKIRTKPDDAFVSNIQSCAGVPSSSFDPNSWRTSTFILDENLNDICLGLYNIPLNVQFGNVKITTGDNRTNYLSWDILDDSNMAHYSVYRKFQSDIDFTHLVNIEHEAKKNGAYSITDKVSQTGNYLYHIEAVDQDGMSYSSQIVSVNVTEEEPFKKVKIFSTIISETIKFEISPSEDTRNISLHDANGRIIYKEEIPPHDYVLSKEIDITSYPSGIFILNEYGKGARNAQKIIKL